MSNFHFPPVLMDNIARSKMTVSCRDCDQIPKVDQAGEIVLIDGQQIQIMHNGIRVVCGGYYGDWMTDIIRQLKGHHEPQEELVFHEVLKHVSPQATMLELGGFWSYYSLWFLSSHADQRKAVVVEPDPNHLSIGRTNADLNRRHITFIQASMGKDVAEVQDFKTESAGVVQIPVLTVELCLRQHAIPVLDVLHCDTQGAETDIIASCEMLFKNRSVRFGIFSTHSHHISGDPLTHQRCLAMLKDFGGRILAEHDVHESFSGDGLIAAYFGDEYIEWREPLISRNRYSTSLFRNPLFDLASK